MTLRLVDNPVVAAPKDEWPLPMIAAYVEQSAQLRLSRDLRRYAAGEIEGRSYLIAGHRGAGKTGLVSRAIDLVRIEIMRASMREEGTALPERPFQRPLFVKLHGPSMLGPGAEPASPDLNLDAASRDDASLEKDTAKERADAAAGEKPPPPSPGVHAALVQMGIGLYRALATELATGFRAHARLRDFDQAIARGQDPRLASSLGDGGELAAQLALDLDVSAAAGRLREYWLRIGRLSRGVLWPKSADDTLHSCRMDDQGAREIIAAATASQAFEVCSGRVTYGTTRKNSDAQKAVTDTKGSADARDLLERFGSLGVGAVAGAAVLPNGGPVGAIVAGFLTFGLGSLAISWSRTRTREDDQTVDYSFIRDRDPATLDRDLPVVITRLRQAGLAPVFVIDELDKVTNAPDEICRLVGRLKHLVADFGFFCFLVDRPCYEEFQRRLDRGGYPVEHTLFTERLLLTLEPGALYRYLLARVVADPGDNTLTARAVFSLETTQRARMNLTNLKRVMARAVRDPGGSLGEPAEWLQQRRQVLATQQLAINETLHSPQIADRINEDPRFAQLAGDTLYYPAFEVDHGRFVVDVSKDVLSRHLAKQGQLPSGQPEGNGVAFVSDEDLGCLHAALLALLKSLSDLKGLRSELSKRLLSGEPGTPGADDATLADVVPRELGAIVEREREGAYRFLFDRNGEPIDRQTGRLAKEQTTRLTALADFAQAFRDVLATFAVTLDELADTPLISGLSDAAVVQAIDGARVAVRTQEGVGETPQHLATLERLITEVRRSRAKLALLLVISTFVRAAAHRSDSVIVLIKRMIPLARPPKHWLDGWTEVVSPLPLTPEELKSWGEAVLRSPQPMLKGNNVNPEDYEPFLKALAQAASGQPATYRFRFDDLVMAGLHHPPYSAVTSDLGAMTAGDWSALALAALPTDAGESAKAPYWVLVAALRGLGFGAPALGELVDVDAVPELAASKFIVSTSNLSPDMCMSQARSFVDGAAERPTGVVVFDTDEAGYGRARPSSSRPTLMVHASEAEMYAQALNWLAANGILSLSADARSTEANR